MGCFRSLLRYSLFGINFIFTILGPLIAISAIVLYNVNGIDSGHVKVIRACTLCLLIIGVVGFVVFFTSIFGCVGSIKENKCCLMLFTVFLMLLVGGKVYIVIKYYNMEEIQTPAKKVLEKTFFSPIKNDYFAFHVAEYYLHCCGIDEGPISYKIRGPQKYQIQFPFSDHETALPPSCCSKKITDLKEIQREMIKQANLMQTGLYDLDSCTLDKVTTGVSCTNKLHDYIDTYGKIVLNTIIGIIVVEIVEALAAIVLCIGSNSRSQKRFY